MITTAACPDFAFPPDKDAPASRGCARRAQSLLGKSESRPVRDRTQRHTLALWGAALESQCRLYFRWLLLRFRGRRRRWACVFSLGAKDTAGSGRVSGHVQQYRWLETHDRPHPAPAGVLPACKTLDCVAIFANSAGGCHAVLNAVEGQIPPTIILRAPTNKIASPATPRLGVLPAKAIARDFAGRCRSAALYAAASPRREALGWQAGKNSTMPRFEDIAALLVRWPLCRRAPRGDSRRFSDVAAANCSSVVRERIAGAHKFTAADVFPKSIVSRRSVAWRSAAFATCDVLLLPTAPTPFAAVAEMLAEPIEANATLGPLHQFRQYARSSPPSRCLPVSGQRACLSVSRSLALPSRKLRSAPMADALHTALGAGSVQAKLCPSTRLPAPKPEDVTWRRCRRASFGHGVKS